MNTVLAAAAAALFFAAPAFAAEEYPSGSPLVLSDRVPASDTGSAGLPRFNGQALDTAPQLRLTAPNGAEASVETMNSETVALGTYHASIGLTAQR
ncbi:MAG: hypothetical protein JOZ05_10895 [Acetobacteraceae bacterium]|nr:hypothetical protein [Acetobacteraceae bacterium]